MDMKTAYISLGANIGDTHGNLREAIRLLDEDLSCAVTAVSSFYETKPVGLEDQPDFLNAVIAIQTSLDPDQLLDLCHSIEAKMGRVRTIRWGPRVIDIDIIVYEGVEMSRDDLIIPHPRMMERGFVLIPLAEIAPDLKLPNGMTAKEAAAQIHDF